MEAVEPRNGCYSREEKARASFLEFNPSSVLFALSAVSLFLAFGPAETARSETAPPGLIVFSSNRSGPWHIWSVRPDGSDLKEITKSQTRQGEGGADENDVDPAIAPDGKSILFSSTRDGKVGVWRMALDGSKMERLSDGDQAEWSPDGKRIALRRSERIYVRDLAGGAEKCITPEKFAHCSGPAWSPDGKTVAFACRWDAGNAIYTVAADGGEPVKAYGEQGACEPHWSPDGKRLVYETETHVATVSPDGKDNRLLTAFGGVQRYPRWSPDGKFIVFCQGASERGPWELYIIPAAGGRPTKVTEDGSDMNPDWK
jgi:Tol biopolymer transport system component